MIQLGDMVSAMRASEEYEDAEVGGGVNGDGQDMLNKYYFYGINKHNIDHSNNEYKQ